MARRANAAPSPWDTEDQYQQHRPRRRPRPDSTPVGRERVDPARYVPIEENPALETARGLGEWLGVILIAVVAALLVKTLLVQPFYIPSGSMIPTLNVDDRVLVNKLSYKVGGVHRGDVVVFKRPPNEPDVKITDLVKRVIALPGETVEARNGVVYINDQLLDEPYLPPNTITDNLPSQVVPPGTMWLMGDNRGNSSDSRVFGPVEQKLLVGRAFLRVWPVSRIGGVPSKLEGGATSQTENTG